MSLNPANAICPTTYITNFNGCVQNAFYIPSTGNVVSSVDQVCLPKQLVSQAAHYDCLCTTSKLISSCYSQYCATDKGAAQAYASQASYCTSAAAFPLPSTTTTVAAVVVPTTVAAGSASSASATVLSLPPKSGSIPVAATGFVGIAICLLAVFAF
ncbi:hypothetical protein BDR26DRAFT_854542 [Obelidium mucronatum]|nr:hypothetical protein BDR26DRAFT_854542 [Obelidium mucronatum]